MQTSWSDDPDACWTGCVLVSQTAMNRHKSKGHSRFSPSLFTCGLIACLLAAGCKTPHCSEQDFARPFDPQRVAQLAHDSYKVAWGARFWARYDLTNTVYHPTGLDWEAVRYINRLSQKLPWVAHDVEKNPTSPRCSSKASYDLVAFDAKMLKARYRPASFRPETDAKIERLLTMMDEISFYYQLKSP